MLVQKVPKRGADPGQDAREKQLLKLATRGVVLLFNAVNKAQKQKADAQLTGKKAAKLNKASFLAELKAGSSKAVAGGGAANTGSSFPIGSALSHHGSGAADSQQHEHGWEALGEGFPGLIGGSKMKDWDKQVGDLHGGDETEPGQIAGSSDDEDDDHGW